MWPVNNSPITPFALPVIFIFYLPYLVIRNIFDPIIFCGGVFIHNINNKFRELRYYLFGNGNNNREPSY